MFDEHKPTPNRPRHQVVRSITDSSSPKLIGHILRHKQERGHHGSQPDLRPSGSQAEVRSEWNTPERSLNPSRRPSLLANAADGHESAKMATSLRSERRPVKDGEVEEEKGKTVLMAAELRNTLMDLNAQSNNTTRRLDTTYYSVLEKISLLQNTISSLKELALMARELNKDFKTESEEVVEDIQTQMSSFNAFDQQQQKVSSLAGRVNQGREKIKTLSERVEVVQKRVSGWEEAEEAWQENTRKRLRILWVLIALVVAGIAVFMCVPKGTGTKTEFVDLAASLPKKVVNGTLEAKKVADQIWSELRENQEPGREGQGQETDDRLRALDL